MVDGSDHRGLAGADLPVTAAWDSLRQVIQLAAKGDASAREQLVAECYSHVRKIVHRDLEQDFRRRHRWIAPLFSTHDVVHDVLAAVVNDLEDTKFEAAEKFYAYLGTLVRHRLLDAVRFHEAGRRDQRRNVANRTEGVGVNQSDGRENTPTMAAALGEQARLVRGALEDMPERQRRLLEMRLMEGATFSELRSALGYSSDETARQAFHAAQARLLVKLRSLGLSQTRF